MKPGRWKKDLQGRMADRGGYRRREGGGGGDDLNYKLRQLRRKFK